jgi:hypothetical protein
MPILKIRSLTCKKTEDYMGCDEIYITVRGQKVWGPTNMNTSPADLQTKTIDVDTKFDNRVRIDLWDEDSGWGDDNDHLGRTYAYAGEVGLGEREYVFRGCGASYRMTYEVLA